MVLEMIDLQMWVFFIEQINKLVDRKKIIIGLFIDLKKGFDTIDMPTKYY